MPCYFFSANEYVRVTRGATGPGTIAPGYPKSISTWGWGNFGKNGIDATLYSGAADYFFSGTEYIRVTRGITGPGAVDPGYPKPISTWGWGEFGKSGIDAALYSGTADYFFSGTQYIRVTRGMTGPGKVDPGYPKSIATWGWGNFGKNGIDAALYSGAADYFFSGTQYIRVTRGATGPGTVDAGYPKPISAWGWGNFGAHGISDALYSGVDSISATAQPAPVTCKIGLDYYFIEETRSREKDTNFVSVSVAVGSQSPRTTTQPLGDVGKSDAAYNLGMYFPQVVVAPGENVVLIYSIVNAGHTDASAIVQGLETATEALVTKAAAAVATVAATAVGAALGASIGTGVVPLIGTALGALAGWLTNTAFGLAFADCDGAVAAAVHVLSYDQIKAAVAEGGNWWQTDDHPGTTSSAGCGANSHYYVKWSIQ